MISETWFNEVLLFCANLFWLTTGFGVFVRTYRNKIRWIHLRIAKLHRIFQIAMLISVGVPVCTLFVSCTADISGCTFSYLYHHHYLHDDPNDRPYYVSSWRDHRDWWQNGKYSVPIDWRD